METYVIAVRPEKRSGVTSDWSCSLRAIPGVEIVGDANPYRLRVKLTEAALRSARSRFSSLCHIEPLRTRVTLAG